MNDNRFVNSLQGYAGRLLDILLLSKRFHFTVSLPVEVCVERLRSVSQPKTAYFNLTNQTVKVAQEGITAPFEICIQRRGGSFFYNSAKANGIIAPMPENAETTVIEGTIRLGISYLGIAIIGLVLFLVNIGDFPRSLGFMVATVAVMLINLPFGLRDARRLEALLRDTFADENRVTHEQS